MKRNAAWLAAVEKHQALFYSPVPQDVDDYNRRNATLDLAYCEIKLQEALAEVEKAKLALNNLLNAKL